MISAASSRLAYWYDQLPADLKLFDERLWHLRPAGRHEYRVKRRIGIPAVRSVRISQRDVADAEQLAISRASLKSDSSLSTAKTFVASMRDIAV